MRKAISLWILVCTIVLRSAEQRSTKLLKEAPLVLNKHNDTVNSVHWSSEGFLVSGSEDESIKIWNPTSGKLIKSIKVRSNGPFGVHIARWSPDNSLIAYGCDDTIVRIMTYPGGQTRVLKGHTEISNFEFYGGLPRTKGGAVYDVRWSEDGSQLTSCSMDTTIKTWDVQSKQCLKTLEGHTDRVYAIALSLERALLASGSSDKSIRLWDRHNQSCIKKLAGHTDSVCSVDWHPNSVYLLSSSWDNTIKIWDARNPREAVCSKTLKKHRKGPMGAFTGGSVYVVKWSSTGDHFASGAHDRTIKVWECNALRPQLIQTLDTAIHDRFHLLQFGQVKSLDWSSDGRLAAGDNNNLIHIFHPRSQYQEEQQQVIILDDEPRGNNQPQEEVRIEEGDDVVIVQIPDAESHALLDQQRRSSDSHIIEVNRSELLEHEKIQLMAMVQELKDTIDKKDEELKDLQDQFHRAEQKVEELRNQLEPVGHDREAEVKDLQDQHIRAQEEVERLRSCFDEKCSFYGNKEVQLQKKEKELAKLSALLEARYQIDSPQSVSVYNIHQEGDYHEAQECCNNWLCNFLCCHYCCIRCKDCCKGNRFQLRASVS